jgi:chromosome segregation ATPase
MREDVPKIEVSQDSSTYFKNVENFNLALNSAFLDIQRKIDLITQSISELDKARQNNVDPAYVSKLESRIGKLSSDLNSVVSSFNTSVDKMSSNYKDSFDRISKINSTVDSISLAISKLSAELNKTVNDFNAVSRQVIEKSEKDSLTVNRLEDSFVKLSDMIKANISELNANDNEMAEKINKLSETVYSGLPPINTLVDDISKLKQLNSSVNGRFENLTNSVNGLTVETNGLNLKLETLGKEFQNIQEGIGDTQKHVMDFINLARSTATSLSSYNPESLNIEIKRLEDRTDKLEKELSGTLENYGALDKSISVLSNKITDLYVVKNATKLFDNMQATARRVDDDENRMNAQASKIEVMFNEITSYMNKFVDTNNRLNDVVRRLSDIEMDIGKIKSGLSLFATKDDIIELHGKLDSISKEKI